MVAPKGNEYWKLAKSWGRDKSYTPDLLWGKALEYFEWVERNPLKEEKVFSNGKRLKAGKIRAMTVRGFCIFAQIATSTFQQYEEHKDFSVITARIRDIIYSQKFEGAAAGLLESNIIARELGLADKQNVEMTSRDIAKSPLNDLPVEKLIEIEKLIKGE